MSVTSLRRFSTGLLAAAAFTSTSLAVADAPGGILEKPETASHRDSLSQNQIQNFLPERGKFTFPAPYNTEAVRLTNASDCNGADCVFPVGYSYWRNINNHVGQDTMLIFLGFNINNGGAGPSLIEYNKNTDEVSNVGPLFDSNSQYAWGHGEGWYFSATQPNDLYVFNSSQIQRYDVRSRNLETVVDINSQMGGGYALWQPNSSDDDRVHSATVRDANSYAMLGCMAYTEDTGNFQYFPRVGNDFDECQVDRSGEWLLIKENVDGRNGEDNRIINLQTGQERVLLDADGAGGHSDMGHGYMVAADNWANNANTVKVWDFNSSNLQGEVAYSNQDWGVSAPNHLSHTNARSGVARQQQYACGSSANYDNSVHANEIICFRLDGSRETLTVAPVMTDLNGGGSNSTYNRMPKGNLDVTGKYFIWTSNMGGGSRLDAFIVKVPGHRLLGTSDTEPDANLTTESETEIAPVQEQEQSDTSEPTSEPTPDSGDLQPVSWTNLTNASASGNTLTKNAGCNGCPDAGAVSSQSLSTAGSYVEFTVNDADPVRFLGLNNGQSVLNGGALNFAVRIQAGIAEVRENGAYRGDTRAHIGDVFRIRVQNDRVEYLRNGTVFHTTIANPTLPMKAEALLFDSGSRISNAQLVSSDSGDNTVTDETTSDETVQQTPTSWPVAWTDLINARTSGTTLIKRAGCNGCPDAGAVSSQSLSTFGSYLEFTVNDTNSLRYIGLNSGLSSVNGGSMEFAIRIQSGIAEVRENYAYRGDTPARSGDVFQIRVSADRVDYLRNGSVFHTSSANQTSPMRAEALLYDRHSQVSDAVLVSAGQGGFNSEVHNSTEIGKAASYL